MYIFETLFLLSLTFLQVRSNGNVTNVRYLLDVVYWEVKPFIFTNEQGNLDGIIPQIFEEATYYCAHKANSSGNVKIAKFTRSMPSRQSFVNLFQSNTSYGKGLLANVSSSKAFWAPILSSKKTSSSFEKKRGIKTFQLTKINQIALIVPRYWISLPNKIISGIFSCRAIFLIAFMLSALLSMIMWFIEHFENKSFGDSFLKGSGTGLWWSIVSMTTVGYGDVVPKSVLGRFVAVIWLIVGLLVACVMTATMTDVVSGVADLQVRGKSVSVLENSYEAIAAGWEYGAEVLPGKSYGEVLQLLRDGKVFGAMMNADIAAWYQNEIIDDAQDVPLRIASILPARLSVDCSVSRDRSEEMYEVFKCMSTQKEEVYESSIESYHKYCDTESLYIGSFKELFQSRFVQVLFLLVCIMFVLGIAYDLFCCYKSRNDLPETCKKLYVEQKDSEHIYLTDKRCDNV